MYFFAGMQDGWKNGLTITESLVTSFNFIMYNLGNTN